MMVNMVPNPPAATNPPANRNSNDFLFPTPFVTAKRLYAEGLPTPSNASNGLSLAATANSGDCGTVL